MKAQTDFGTKYGDLFNPKKPKSFRNALRQIVTHNCDFLVQNTKVRDLPIALLLDFD